MTSSEIVYTHPKYIGLVVIAMLVIVLTCFLALRQFIQGPDSGTISKTFNTKIYTMISPYYQ